ncbi:sulfite exporter TauE/SafE family protein [Oceaniglobus roseus]|uniref:sulfite exporter TauE/SafE family protein n=1 Tax=Oceaniglobus roseus TaxID=1737570 RepID=UPI000C7EB90D|nr:sulfite exporter TauE/SafE family protein [Kandeliimicrobium roseum]
MIELDLPGYVAIFIALALGGILKGATGMGAPVVAIPVMAAFFDVRLAVVLMVLPNLCTNLTQLWTWRARRPDRLAWSFAIAGGIGALLGTFLLVSVPARALTLTVALAVLGYVGLRLAKADFHLPEPLARRLSPPAGIAAGLLQGAAGISAPVSVSFLNAIRMERGRFIPTISLFFTAMCVTQLPTLIGFGLYDLHMVVLSALALVPLLGFMPVGARLARSISARAFDRLTLSVLVVLAIKLIVWP